MGSVIVEVGSFFLSLIAGDSFSFIVSPTEKVKKALDNEELKILLDEYHRWFIREKDSEISSSNADMTILMEKREELLDSFDQHFLNSNIDICVNRKEQFLNESYQIVCPNGTVSEIWKTYLGGFFQLVLTQTTKGLPPEIKTYFNHLADQINERIGKPDRENSEAKKTDTADFTDYYADVLKAFTEPNEEKSANLVGEESDEKAYIDAFINVGSGRKLALEYLEEWFNEKKYGVILIYGEPGHGKSMLCKKATVDYLNGIFLNGKANNVLTVSLNSGYNPKIVENNDIVVRNALVWGPDKEHPFDLEDCQESILFMDGFDEFIDVAKSKNKDINIVSFMRHIDKVAKQYNIHVVVLSRTTAVKKYIEEKAIAHRCFQLLPITDDQQDMWLKQHIEYDDYRNTFNRIRKDKNMRELLGVPLLFRLIVHNGFSKLSSNIVELYDNLFLHLMDKRAIRDGRLMSVRKGLMNLAYNIYCTDTNLAVVNKEDLDKDWVFAFYLTVSEIKNGSLQSIYKVGFFHRTFYQYFLAKYIYSKLLKVTNKKAKKFIGYFAERELDDEVRFDVSLMLKKEDKKAIYSKMDIVINALAETEAYCNYVPKYDYGDAEKKKINRSANIYRNIIDLAKSIGYIIQIPFKGNLDILIRTFKSFGIVIHSSEDQKANLAGANLTYAKLSWATFGRADMRGACLDGADLQNTSFFEANLKGADLCNARMKYANFEGADLRDTHICLSDLSHAVFYRAILEKADLRGSNLNGAIFNEANLKGAKIEYKYKSLIDSSLEGYDSIEWVFLDN